MKLTSSGILVALFLLILGGGTTFLYLNVNTISNEVTLMPNSMDGEYRARFRRERALKGAEKSAVYEFFSEEHQARISVFSDTNQGDQTKLLQDPYGSLLRFRSGADSHEAFQTQSLKFANANIDPRKAQEMTFAPLKDFIPAKGILFDASAAQSQVASFKIKDEYFALFFVTTSRDTAPCNQLNKKWPYVPGQLQTWIISSRTQIELKRLLTHAVICK